MAEGVLMPKEGITVESCIMQAALNGTDPCVIFESQRIYGKGEEFHEGGVPAEEYEWPVGGVNKVRDGKDLTILTIGATLYRAVDAAKELSEKYGVEADVINMGRASFGELFSFSEAFCEAAGECGHRSFTIMFFAENDTRPQAAVTACRLLPADPDSKLQQASSASVSSCEE